MKHLASLAMAALLFSPLTHRVLAATNDTAAPTPTWDQVRRVTMSGGLRVFWNVHGGDNALNYREAAAHGFEMVTLLNTYSDYPGRQKENISTALATNRNNPWRKPEFFERIIKRNIASRTNEGALFVHDIEFSFEEDTDKAWADPAVCAASHATTREQFAAAYFREWATWFSLPCTWAKEKFPGKPVGIYGPQPFRRDYWGLTGKRAQQMDGTHRTDAELWQHIDPTVDFYIASVYVFYEDPGSLYYIAANIEENVERTRRFGNKPLYAYEWLRYHDSNKKLAGRELAPWLVEAMAVLPYFSGARGLVVWGSEPKLKGQYYRSLPAFCSSLGRVADLSGKMAKAQRLPDVPAHQLWKAKQPLVRRLQVAAGEWVVLAVNPWQADDANSSLAVELGGHNLKLELRGKHTELFHVTGSNAKRL
jgi:hypothetical protein